MHHSHSHWCAKGTASHPGKQLHRACCHACLHAAGGLKGLSLLTCPHPNYITLLLQLRISPPAATILLLCIAFLHPSDPTCVAPLFRTRAATDLEQPLPRARPVDVGRLVAGLRRRLDGHEALELVSVEDGLVAVCVGVDHHRADGAQLSCAHPHTHTHHHAQMRSSARPGGCLHMCSRAPHVKAPAELCLLSVARRRAAAPA